ncbi:MAG TPA: hypothetical protein VHQ02_00345 [Usitatibacter sp.]|nr:hypothetical protein [Usitatibacter sp.]
MRKLIVGSIAAALMGLAAIPAAARSNVELFVDVAPPPVRYEVVPAPRVGWVWAPGFWEWRHGRHFWVAGHWIRERRGYVYRPAGWAYYGGRWGYRPGIWVRPW